MNLIDALWDLGPVRKLMALQEAKKQKMEAIENALHHVDADGDGKTDIKELEGKTTQALNKSKTRGYSCSFVLT